MFIDPEVENAGDEKNAAYEFIPDDVVGCGSDVGLIPGMPLVIGGVIHGSSGNVVVSPPGQRFVSAAIG